MSSNSHSPCASSLLSYTPSSTPSCRIPSGSSSIPEIDQNKLYIVPSPAAHSPRTAASLIHSANTCHTHQMLANQCLQNEQCTCEAQECAHEVVCELGFANTYRRIWRGLLILMNGDTHPRNRCSYAFGNEERAVEGVRVRATSTECAVGWIRRIRCA
ncbi:hypothetical protein BDP27DRAFT_153478 [Rhodocollybia butyracea]|uniref:Uncharacterized protein n=1 Tax=Rhodocollybia butyracea TaxID=206335 RepID=A0A9P5PFC6_9AGAR|nr:hypothetical protein BDP27DRAFT_153478 [Rhodocollybia butyracea]